MASVVRVGKGEMTCTVCGEVTSVGYCARCNDESDEEHYNHHRDHNGDSEMAHKLAARLVPTTSYLYEWEYSIVGG